MLIFFKNIVIFTLITFLLITLYKLRKSELFSLELKSNLKKNLELKYLKSNNNNKSKLINNNIFKLKCKKFYLEDNFNRPSFYDKENFDRLYNFMINSKYYTKNKDKAFFIFIKILSLDELNTHLNLPKLSNKVYVIYLYLFNFEGVNYEKYLSFLNRNDIIFLHWELRDLILSSEELVLPGVTLPAVNFISHFKKIEEEKKNKYLISFSGDINNDDYDGYSSGIRKKMDNLFKNNDNKRVYYNDSKSNPTSLDTYKDITYNSVYGLCPHGDGRWNRYRLLELVNYNTIPVIIADGITLPYEQIINWDLAIIRIKEDKFKKCNNLDEFLKLLPKNKNRIIKMKKNLNKIKNVFKSEDIILKNLLKCCLQHYKKINNV